MVVKASGVAPNATSMGVARRFVWGRFAVFVAVYEPHGRRYEHGHEDQLSYSIFLDGNEFAVDAGRPTYAQDEIDWHDGQWHNGLYAPGKPICPRHSVWTPRRWRNPKVSMLENGAQRAHWRVENAALNRSKDLIIEADNADALYFRERLSGPGPFKYCLMLPGVDIFLYEGRVISAAWQIETHGLSNLSLEKAPRAVDYDVREDCMRLSADAAQSVETSFRHV